MSRPLEARLRCQRMSEEAFGRSGVRQKLRQKMVDAAIRELESVEQEFNVKKPTPELLSRDNSALVWGVRPHREYAARHVAVVGAWEEAKSAGLLGWIAFQIFKTFVVKIIVDWWVNRETVGA